MQSETSITEWNKIANIIALQNTALEVGRFLCSFRFPTIYSQIEEEI